MSSKILYYNNCWFTNVGEAFIDIGAMEFIRKIFPESKIACLSPMSDYYMRYMNNRQFKELVKNRLKKIFLKQINYPVRMDSYLDADYIILAGMFATIAFLNSQDRLIVENLVKKGAKLIFLGLGGAEYTKVEINAFGSWLKDIKPCLVMTRDQETYKNYNAYVDCYCGIDVAFWVKDVFDPRGFSEKKYDVVTYNYTGEPKEFSHDWPNEIVRPWHMQYTFRTEQLRKNLLISDTPYDYLTAYANANKIYTDLVHASIIGLQYGKEVRYSYYDKRSGALEAVEDIVKKTDGSYFVEETRLEEQKRKIEKDLIAILNGGYQ